MDAKELRKLNNYQNALKKNFMAGKQAIEYSLDIIDTIDDLYKDNYKNLEKRNFFRFFYPLEMLVDVAQNIEAKSKILKSNYLNAIKKNDFVSSAILIRSDLELTYFYVYLISKSLDYLENNNWKDFIKILFRIDMGKVKNSSFDNRLIDLLKTAYTNEFENIDKKIHLNDVLKYLENYDEQKFKDKVLNVLQKNSLIFHQDKLISKHRSAQINKGHVIENIEWKDSIGHYGSLSEIVHPTAFFMVDKLSTFDLLINDDPKFTELNKFNFDGDVLEKIEAINSSLGSLHNLATLKEITINIYLFYEDKFSQNKKVVYNALGLKLIKETDDLMEIENLSTKDILRLGLTKK
jgi:hypothetical protein